MSFISRSCLTFNAAISCVDMSVVGFHLATEVPKHFDVDRRAFVQARDLKSGGNGTSLDDRAKADCIVACVLDPLQNQDFATVRPTMEVYFLVMQHRNRVH